MGFPRDIGIALVGGAVFSLIGVYSLNHVLLGILVGLAAGVVLLLATHYWAEHPRVTGAAIAVVIGSAVVAGLAFSPEPPKVGVKIENAVAEWNSTTFEGSHWGGKITWSTTSAAGKCTISDDQGTAPETVSATPLQSLGYGSYAPETRKAIWSVRCGGGGPGESDSRAIKRPPAPRVRIELGRFFGNWLTHKHTRWEIRMTWTSHNAVECRLHDSYRPNPDGLHADRSGAADRGYGDFPATVELVQLRIACYNVALMTTEHAVNVTRPRP
jgi:hypothetical protein